MRPTAIIKQWINRLSNYVNCLDQTLYLLPGMYVNRMSPECIIIIIGEHCAEKTMQRQSL